MFTESSSATAKNPMANALAPTESGSRSEATESFEDLRLLAEGIASGLADAESYQHASKLLIQCLDVGTHNQTAAAGYARWSEEPKRAFLEQLLLQKNCSARPFVFLHVVCGFASAGVGRVGPAVANALAPIIMRLLDNA